MKDSSLWEQIKGHDKTVNLLRGVIDKKRLTHAYLFCGPRGVGKAKTAATFAAAINCDQACGTCVSCRGIQNLTHPDFHYISPEGTQTILLSQVTDLIKKIHLTKQNNGYRVIIIDDAHKMLPVAANALLKVLEEPPERVVFILVASDMNNVLSTISSRCQRVNFAALKVEVVRDILINDLKISKDKADLAVMLSGGMVGEAMEIASSGLLKVRKTMVDAIVAEKPDTARSVELASLLVAAAKKRTAKIKKDQEIEVKEAMSFVEGSRGAATIKRNLETRHHRERARVEHRCYQQALVLVASIYRDLLVLKENADEKFIANVDLSFELKSAKIERAQLTSALANIDEAKQRIEQNVNPLLAFENLFFTLEAVV